VMAGKAAWLRDFGVDRQIRAFLPWPAGGEYSLAIGFATLRLFRGVGGGAVFACMKHVLQWQVQC
jgi:hypothetical protein